MEEIKVTLLSHPEKDYPDNTPTRFRNQIDLGLDPGKDYEVALHSVSFMNAYINFKEGRSYWVEYYSGATNTRRRRTLPAGYYSQKEFTYKISNYEKLVRNPNETVFRQVGYHAEALLEFNSAINRFEIVFTKEHQGKRISVNLYNEVRLSPDMAQLLGFDETHFVWDTTTPGKTVYTADRITDWGQTSLIAVQCSLAMSEHHLSGGKYSILNLIPLQNTKFGERVYFQATVPIWYKLNRADVFHPLTLLTCVEADNQELAFNSTTSLTLRIREIP